MKRILEFIKTFLLMLMLSTSFLANAAETSTSLEAGIEDLAVNISNQMTAKGIQKIAIVDFTDLNGYQSALGDFVSEELVTNFYTHGAGKFDVVERRELNRVIEEQKLGSSGLLNKDTIAKIGEILGIDAIVTGSIAYLGSNIKVNARMIGVNDAKVFAAASQKIFKDETAEALMQQGGGRSISDNASSAQSYKSKYEIKILRAIPISVIKNSDKKTVAVSVEFENKTKEDLVIRTAGGNSCARLSSRNGAVLYTRTCEGMGYSKVTIIESGGKIEVLYVFDMGKNVLENPVKLLSSISVRQGEDGREVVYEVNVPNLTFQQ